MPKSPRGNFNYVDIMYKPFNSSITTAPTTLTAHSQGYRAPTHETHEPQLSNPAFSPTVHVPQSVLSNSNPDDGYRALIDELPSHMTNQAFGFRPQQHEYQRQHEHQRQPSVESAPRPLFDALQHHQNIHQQSPQHPKQSLQHGVQYQSFNQQHDLSQNTNNHSDSLEQHHQNGRQQQLHNARPVPSRPPPGPPVQLVNGMHPARLALLQTAEEPEPEPEAPVLSERRIRKRAKAAEKAAAPALMNKVQGNSTAAASSSSAPAPAAAAPPATATPTPPVAATPTPAAAKSNAPKPKLVVPAPTRASLNADHLTVQLQAAIASKSAKKLCNTVRKAAGECILRAFIYIMSRNFSFMSLDLFLNLYCKAFGCPTLTEPHMHDSMLEAKLFKPMIETKIENGYPHRKFYRLNPLFFRVLEDRTNSTANIPAECKEVVMYDLANKANLPPVAPIPSDMVTYLLNCWDLKIYNIALTHLAYTPARWPTVAPLNDLQPFLAYWYTPQYEFSQHLAPLKSIAAAKAATAAGKAKAKTGSTPTDLAPSSPPATTSTNEESTSTSTSTPTVDAVALAFELLLDTAKLQGKPGNESRRLLRMYEQRLVDANVEVLPQVTAILEDDALSENSDMELDDGDDDDAPAAIDLTPAPVAMTVCSPANDATSTPTTFTRTNGGPSIGATLQGPGGPAVQSSQILVESHAQTPTQSKGKMPDRTGGPVRFSMKQVRYQPYVDLHTGEGIPRSDSSKQSKSMGVDGTSTKGSSDRPRPAIPSNRNLPTLPRPLLPPLEGQGSSSADPMTLAMLAGGVGSDMTTTEPLLRRSRDDILMQRRMAMNKIIEYTMKMPMKMGPKD
ncbi:hypothetical protein EC957_009635 [Mortierella hygrophila]|uniref:Uncharacterized protein n=1 Tax=Mortierella hygrophila TaxID=979708 RepID=A0A9P6FA46_9FUNG|nr:hypothetical protein EC957_009635 [Mortierella hygrophila]